MRNLPPNSEQGRQVTALPFVGTETETIVLSGCDVYKSVTKYTWLFGMTSETNVALKHMRDGVLLTALHLRPLSAHVPYLGSEQNNIQPFGFPKVLSVTYSSHS